MTKSSVDWDRVEIDYRAGVLTLREMGAKHGVAESAIRKRAKRDSWLRDLSAKIKMRAEDLVRKEEVRKEVRTAQKSTERVEVEASAQIIANVRMAHRTDIGRCRRLANKLLDELEGLTDNRDLFDELGELLRNADDNGQDKRNDLYQKVIDLPSRTKTLKELGETLKTLITLERQAYDVGTQSPEDDRTKLSEEEIDRRIAKLAGMQG